MRSWGVLACVLGSAIAGCGAHAFSCTDHAMCDRSPGGRCELSGYCSFPDPGCPSGFRFGEHAPAGVAMQCTEPDGDSEVDPTLADAGSSVGIDDADPTTGDAMDDDPSASGESSGPAGCVAWWNCAWGFRREIVVSGAVGETLENFAVPLTLEDVSDPARFGPDGLDVRVIAEDGTMLPIDVETWEAGAPAVIWVALQRVEPSVGARAWLYYGNPSAPAEDTAAAVWDASFAAVWHLSSTDDSTANDNHAEDQGSVSKPGMIGAGRAFESAGQRLVVPASDSLADLAIDGITITAWMRPLTPGFVSGGRIIDNADGTAALVGFSLLTSPTALGLEWNRGAATTEASWIDMDTLAYGRWQHVALTFVDGEAPHGLVDGMPIAFEDITLAVGAFGSDVGSPFGIGGAPYDDTHTFDGTLDELRVSREVRSDAWILAEMQSATGDLVTLGSEEEAPT